MSAKERVPGWGFVELSIRSSDQGCARCSVQVGSHLAHWGTATAHTVVREAVRGHVVGTWIVVRSQVVCGGRARSVRTETPWECTGSMPWQTMGRVTISQKGVGVSLSSIELSSQFSNPCC